MAQYNVIAVVAGTDVEVLVEQLRDLHVAVAPAGDGALEVTATVACTDPVAAVDELRRRVDVVDVVRVVTTEAFDAELARL